MVEFFKDGGGVHCELLSGEVGGGPGDEVELWHSGRGVCGRGGAGGGAAGLGEEVEGLGGRVEF